MPKSVVHPRILLLFFLKHPKQKYFLSSRNSQCLFFFSFYFFFSFFFVFNSQFSQPFLCFLYSFFPSLSLSFPLSLSFYFFSNCHIRKFFVVFINTAKPLLFRDFLIKTPQKNNFFHCFSFLFLLFIFV